MAPHQEGMGEVLGCCQQALCQGLSHQKPLKLLGRWTLGQTKGRLLFMRFALWVYTAGTLGYAPYSVPKNYNLEVKWGFGVWFCFFFNARKLHSLSVLKIC